MMPHAFAKLLNTVTLYWTVVNLLGQVSHNDRALRVGGEVIQVEACRGQSDLLTLRLKIRFAFTNSGQKDLILESGECLNSR